MKIGFIHGYILFGCDSLGVEDDEGPSFRVFENFLIIPIHYFEVFTQT